VIKLIGSRLLQMILIMGVVSFMLFFIFDSDKFKKQIAVAELGGFAISALSDQDYNAWLERKLAGDMTAARIVLDRIAPPRKGRPVQFPLPQIRLRPT
jgi:hypothetical protein